MHACKQHAMVSRFRDEHKYSWCVKIDFVYVWGVCAFHLCMYDTTGNPNHTFKIRLHTHSNLQHNLPGVFCYFQIGISILLNVAWGTACLTSKALDTLPMWVVLYISVIGWQNSVDLTTVEENLQQSAFILLSVPQRDVVCLQGLVQLWTKQTSRWASKTCVTSCTKGLNGTKVFIYWVIELDRVQKSQVLPWWLGRETVTLYSIINCHLSLYSQQFRTENKLQSKQTTLCFIFDGVR